jgi:hypothetical protein
VLTISLHVETPAQLEKVLRRNGGRILCELVDNIVPEGLHGEPALQLDVGSLDRLVLGLSSDNCVFSAGAPSDPRVRESSNRKSNGAGSSVFGRMSVSGSGRGDVVRTPRPYFCEYFGETCSRCRADHFSCETHAQGRNIVKVIYCLHDLIKACREKNATANSPADIIPTPSRPKRVSAAKRSTPSRAARPKRATPKSTARTARQSTPSRRSARLRSQDAHEAAAASQDGTEEEDRAGTSASDAESSAGEDFTGNDGDFMAEDDFGAGVGFDDDYAGPGPEASSSESSAEEEEESEDDELSLNRGAKRHSDATLQSREPKRARQGGSDHIFGVGLANAFLSAFGGGQRAKSVSDSPKSSDDSSESAESGELAESSESDELIEASGSDEPDESSESDEPDESSGSDEIAESSAESSHEASDDVESEAADVESSDADSSASDESVELDQSAKSTPVASSGFPFSPPDFHLAEEVRDVAGEAPGLVAWFVAFSVWAATQVA